MNIKALVVDDSKMRRIVMKGLQKLRLQWDLMRRRMAKTR